jgi:DNA-binding transcriptional MocR family regulator
MRISPRRLDALLGRWTDGTGPLHERLATALRRVIARGDLPAEALLPTERELARELGVSRTTVVAAYGGLKRTGHLASRQGRGTWIPSSQAAPRSVPGAAITSELFAPMLDGEHPDVIDLVAACPDPNPVLREVLGAMDGEALMRGMTGGGYLAAGLPDLRAALAARMSAEGVPTTAEQVVVTAGGHQALSLAVQLLVPPDGAVPVEDPTYPGFLDILRARGARPVPVAMDRHGVDPDALGAAMARDRPRLAYLVPAFHNPTGAVLSPERGARVVELARRHGVPVVDDQVLRDIWIAGRRPSPPLASHDPEAPVITVGSLSKTMWGGLRLGWLRAPRSLAERLARTRILADLGGAVPLQAVALALLPHLDRAAAERRAIVAGAADAFCAAMAERLPDWEVPRPEGGATLWVRMPWGDARGFSQFAQRAGVLVLPGPAMAVRGGHEDRLRISLLADPAVLREGAARLEAAWAAYGRRAERVIV